MSLTKKIKKERASRNNGNRKYEIKYGYFCKTSHFCRTKLHWLISSKMDLNCKIISTKMIQCYPLERSESPNAVSSYFEACLRTFFNTKNI